MSAFRPPEYLIVHETNHWISNHRVNSALPGYFMVGSKMDANDLSDLPHAALSELVGHLAKIQKIITELLSPPQFYVGRGKGERYQP